MKCKFTTLSPKVEANYTVANGYEHDAKVIYGDTDSVMVRYHPNINTTPAVSNRDRYNFVSMPGLV